MRVGTPGFDAGRLAEAMKARGVTTMLALAGMLGKNTSTVSRWLDGTSGPEPDTLVQIATILNVRPDYFLRPVASSAGEERAVFFRSLAAARKRDLHRQEARISWVRDVGASIQRYVEFPTVDIPDVLQGASYRQLRSEDLEAIALELRRHWKLGEGPCNDVVRVMDRVGFVVAVDEMGTASLDGLCEWSEDEGRPYVLLASDKMSFFRRQMDAAHEMAHAVLHRRVTKEDLRRDFDMIERQAFRLASAFLMPSTSYPTAFSRPSLAAFQALKERWRVSIKAQIRRCQDLKILDEDSARSLYKYYSARGWAKEEPLDKLVPPSSPRLIADALELIVSSGGVSKAELLAEAFSIPGEDVAMFAGLPLDWFQKGDVVQLRMRSTPERSSFETIGGGKVMSFDPSRRDERKSDA